MSSDRAFLRWWFSYLLIGLAYEDQVYRPKTRMLALASFGKRPDPGITWPKAPSSSRQEAQIICWLSAGSGSLLLVDAKSNNGDSPRPISPTPSPEGFDERVPRRIAACCVAFRLPMGQQPVNTHQRQCGYCNETPPDQSVLCARSQPKPTTRALQTPY
jgi:hypothetical protein